MPTWPSRSIGGGPGLPAGQAAVVAEQLAELVADGEHRVERGERVLEDHAHPVPAQLPALLGRTGRAGRCRRVAAASAVTVALAVGEPHHRPGRGRLAGAGLAEQRHQFAAGDVEVDVDDRGHRAAAGAERDREAAYLQRGVGQVTHLLSSRCNEIGRSARSSLDRTSCTPVLLLHLDFCAGLLQACMGRRSPIRPSALASRHRRLAARRRHRGATTKRGASMLDSAKRYTGYTAYDYLEPGKDYQESSSTPNRSAGCPPTRASSCPTASASGSVRLLTDEIVISLHDHVQVFPEDMGQLREHIRQGREPTGYQGLARSGMTAVFDNGMDGTCCISSDAGWKYQDVLVRPRRADGRPGAPGLRHQGASRSRTSTARTRPAGWRTSSRWRRPPRSRTRSTGSTCCTASAYGRSASPTPRPTTSAAASRSAATAA